MARLWVAFLVLVLHWHSTLLQCELGSAEAAAVPVENHVARARTLPPPQTVFLPDGSCCYNYESYTFCLNPRFVPPPSSQSCVRVCGNMLCVFDRFGGAGLGRSDIVDLTKFRRSPPRLGGCCKCVKSFITVCVQPEDVDHTLICSSSLCGYNLCFGSCVA